MAKDDNYTIQTNSLAVKYRPQKLEDLVGNQHIATQVRGMLSKRRFPNAILLSGGFGMGKTTVARMLGRYINCATLDACGTCSSCKIHSDFHPDFLEKDMGSEGKVDNIRDIINEAKLAPRYKQRIILLDEAHNLTGAAATALLKMLEEPPKRTMFVLATNNPQKLLPTILSRCLRMELRAPDKLDMAKKLLWIGKQEGTNLTKDHHPILKEVAGLSGGHMRDAIQMLESVLAAIDSGDKFELDDIVKEFVSGTDYNLDMLAQRLLTSVYNGKGREAVRALFEAKDHIRGLMYKVRFLIDLKIGHWADTQKYQTPASQLFDKSIGLDFKTRGNVDATLLCVIAQLINETEVQLNTIPGCDERIALQAKLMPIVIKMAKAKSK